MGSERVKKLPAIVKDFYAETAELTPPARAELEQFMMAVKQAMGNQTIPFNRWRFEQLSALVLEEISCIQQQIQRWIAAQRQPALLAAETIAQKHYSPAWLQAIMMLKCAPVPNRVPLYVMIAPVQIPFANFANTIPPPPFPDSDLTLLQGIRQFLKQYTDQERPIDFISGAWVSEIAHSAGALKPFFNVLHSEPTLLVNTEVNGYYLNSHLGYWRFHWPQPRYETLMTALSYQDILYESAKQRARHWLSVRAQLLAAGEDVAVVDQIGGDNTANLMTWQREEKYRQLGARLDQLVLEYRCNAEDAQHLCQYLILYHCLLIGLVADEYFLYEYQLPPLLPVLLPDLIGFITDPSLISAIHQAVTLYYQRLYFYLEQDYEMLMPTWLVEFAISLAHWPDTGWAKEPLHRSLEIWLKAQGVATPMTILEQCQALESLVMSTDRHYVQRLNECLTLLGEDYHIDIATACLRRGIRSMQDGAYLKALQDFNQAIEMQPTAAEGYYQRGTVYMQLEDYQKALADYTKVLAFNSQDIHAYHERGRVYHRLGDYERAIADYNAALQLDPQFMQAIKSRHLALNAWEVIKRQQEQHQRALERKAMERRRILTPVKLHGWSSQQVQERQLRTAQFVLADEMAHSNQVTCINEITLCDRLPNQRLGPAMVIIPSGIFLMGSPDNEWGRNPDERLHWVIIEKPFAVAKYALNLFEYRLFCEDTQRVCRYQLEEFDTQPMVNITWFDAMDYIEWLTVQTGQTYRLLTEAEWEYACRAGTTTPFWWGHSITSNQANYDGHYGYGNSNTVGEYRDKTLPVETFDPNPWGLYQMHGNVWEWTGSLYDNKYHGGECQLARRDDQHNIFRVLRGGGFRAKPQWLRSAQRYRYRADLFNKSRGVRIARVLNLNADFH